MDQHPLWLDALERLLEKVDVTVVGRTTDVEEATDLLEEHKPDVLVTEYASLTEGEESVPLLHHAKRARADVKCVVLGAEASGSQVAAAFAKGADVFCEKTTSPEDLAFAIRQAFKQSIHFATRHAPSPVAPAPTLPSSAASLTKREIEILRLVSEGYSNSQLARMLWVTEQTVKFHLSNIYRKLDVSNRTEAARWAQVNNLLAPESVKVEQAVATAAA